MISLAIADDHSIYRQGLAALLEKNEDFTVLIQAANGKELIDQFNKTCLPDIVLMDIAMPVMDGKEATGWISANYPVIRVIALTVFNHEDVIHEMYLAGVKGYALKSFDLQQLIDIIYQVYNGWNMFQNLTASNQLNEKHNPYCQLSQKEKEFITLCTTNLTYKEIADTMKISIKTADRHRDNVFKKLNVKNRTSLVIYALQTGVVILEN